MAVRTSRHRRAVSCTALAIAGTAAILPHAVEARPAFRVVGKVATSALPSHAKPGSGRWGAFDARHLASPQLELTLPDGTVVIARRERLDRDPVAGATSWLGAFVDAPGELVELTYHRGAITAAFTHRGVEYEMHTDGSGAQVLYAVDAARLPQLEPESLPRPPLAPDEIALTTVVRAPALTADLAPVVQDLLVTYTPASRRRWGTSLEGRILGAVARANQAYARSQVGVTLNLVGVEPAGVTERSSAALTHEQMRTSATIAATRDRLGADLVILVGENEDVCGTAWMMTSNSTAHERWAHGYVASTCLGGRTLAHEIGHLQGLDHDRIVSPASRGVYAYGTGYASCTRDGAAFYDLMSYGCGSGFGAVLLQQFSNPRLEYRLRPTGIDHESDPARSADAARALNATAATVASYRAAIATPPGAPLPPSSVDASPGAYGRIVVQWTHPAGGATGFMVLRSTDGVRYDEVARVGATAYSYFDDSVLAGRVYAYRVRAYNSNGVSADSATALVTAKVAVPATQRRGAARGDPLATGPGIDAASRRASRR